jgi:hypothetical protein
VGGGVAAGLSAGYGLLRCRPAAAETQLSFAAVADLLTDALDDALPTLPAPQRRALRIALLVDEPAGPPPDNRAIAAGLLGVLRHACASTPVLLAVDDVQWLDESSRTVLEFAVRRLRTERVGLLLARRDSGGELPLGLGRAMAPTNVEQVSLGPMSVGALHGMIQARLGAALSRPVLRRLYASSAGNPFYALEIARALPRRGPALGPGEPLPVPPTLVQLVHERVVALPNGVRRLLEIVATLYDRRLATVRRLAHEEGLDGMIDDAVAAGVLGVHEGRLEFQHPLLASGVYAGMGPERRRNMHRGLVGRDTRNEASTVHLALAAEAPDAEVADELDRSAARARAPGGGGIRRPLRRTSRAPDSAGRRGGLGAPAD